MMHKFEVGDKVVVKYDNYLVHAKLQYEGQIGVIDAIPYNMPIVKFNDGYKVQYFYNNLTPFTGFKVGDFVEVISPSYLHNYGEIIRESLSLNVKPIFMIQDIPNNFYESELKYYRSHFEKETNMLDKEKLHKLVDGIDPEKYNKVDAYVQTKGDVIEERLIQLQKEKSLEERLREVGYRKYENRQENEVYVELYNNYAMVNMLHMDRCNEHLNCPLDFDKIMETIRFLEGRE
jgi:hypothetical protein